MGNFFGSFSCSYGSKEITSLIYEAVIAFGRNNFKDSLVSFSGDIRFDWTKESVFLFLSGGKNVYFRPGVSSITDRVFPLFCKFPPSPPLVIPLHTFSLPITSFRL